MSRVKVQKIREHMRKKIEEEYDYFQDQVKFNSDYNLEKFLKEKRKMREINKTTNIVYSTSEIHEQIG